MRKIILAVDDEQPVLHSLGRMFENKAYDFVPFNSSVEALLALKTVKPHIIISKKRMPHIHGVDFLSRAKAISHRSLRILLTGNQGSEDTIGDHIDRIMMKPWCDDELEYEVRRTTVHHDKIIVPISDKSGTKNTRGCGMCGSDSTSHEIRFDKYTESICNDCRTKLISFTGSFMEPMLMRQMLGNVI